MFEHFLRVVIRDQEADVESLNFLPPQNLEIFRPPHHKTHESLSEEFFDIIGLLDGDGHADGVHRRFDQDLFFVVA